MVQYRRFRVAGGCYFFTVNLRNRRSDFLVRYVHELRQSFLYAKSKNDFRIDAMVVLPNHLHAIWTLPEGDDNYPLRWRSIKSHFTRALKQKNISLTRDHRGEYILWQRRYWEHVIRDEKDFEHHVNYIHYNPVKHGYVKHPIEWPHSSIHRFTKTGLLPLTWGNNVNEINQTYGERSPDEVQRNPGIF